LRARVERSELRKFLGANELGRSYSRLYGNGKLTLARAAREARVSLWEMMDYVKTKKITAHYDLEDFQRDLKTMAASERR
jgi:predicted HTH domain antitoxin